MQPFTPPRHSDTSATPLRQGPAVPAREPQASAVGEQTCVCHHSLGAHRSGGAHPCMLCTCRQYIPPSATELLAATPRVTPEGRRALDILSRAPAFRYIASDTLHTLAVRGRRHLVIAGSVLMTQSIVSDRLFVLSRGRVKLEKTGENMEPREIAQLGPGDIVGGANLLRHAPALATAIALQDLEVLEFETEDLKTISKQDPRLVMALAKAMHERVS